MEQSKKIFSIINLIVVFLLFIFASISLILTAILGQKDNVDMVNIIFAMVYLVMHLVIIGVCIYLTVMGNRNGGKFLAGFMLDSKSKIMIKSAFIKAWIVTGVGLIIFIYFGLLSLGINMPLSFFNIGLKLCLTNVGLGVFMGGLLFAVYPLVFGRKSDEH